MTSLPAGDPSAPASADPVLALLARERAALLDAVASVPPERRDACPDPARWSVAQVLEHLARVERGVHRLLQLRLAEPAPADAAQLAEARANGARLVLVRDRGRRIEAPERVCPRDGLEAAAALARLADERGALETAYAAADDALLDGSVYPHPVFGLLTLRDWTAFVAHHEARHAAQIAELGAPDDA